MSISKHNIRFVHDNKTYQVDLYEKESCAGEKNIVNIGGRNFAIITDSPLPKSVDQLFTSLNKISFLTEKELLEKIESAAATLNLTGLSLSTRVYNLAHRLLSKQYVDSSSATQLKQGVYAALSKCSPTDILQINDIIKKSHYSPREIFEIAEQIQKEGKAELAHILRTVSRPFDLEKTINTLCADIAENYFDEVVGKKVVEAIAKKLKDGAYEEFDDPEDFASTLTNDLHHLSSDKHFEVAVKARGPSQIEPEAKEKEDFGFGRMIFSNNICHLEITKFINPKDQSHGRQMAQERAIAILKEIQEKNPESIIIDLRKNHGGSPYMCELICSYFLPAEVPLTSFKYRVKPVGKETRFLPVEPTRTWSYEQLAEKDRMLKVPIYILTSNETFSAAEDLTCHLKGLERATIVGETTGKGANLAKLFDGGDFDFAIPVGEVIIPYGKNWEGVGIVPDVSVKASESLEKAKSLIEAQRKK